MICSENIVDVLLLYFLWLSTVTSDSYLDLFLVMQNQPIVRHQPC